MAHDLAAEIIAYVTRAMNSEARSSQTWGPGGWVIATSEMLPCWLYLAVNHRITAGDWCADESCTAGETVFDGEGTLAPGFGPILVSLLSPLWRVRMSTVRQRVRELYLGIPCHMLHIAFAEQCSSLMSSRISIVLSGDGRMMGHRGPSLTGRDEYSASNAECSWWHFTTRLGDFFVVTISHQWWFIKDDRH